MSSQVENGVRYYLGPRPATDIDNVTNITVYGDTAQVEIYWTYDQLPDPTNANYIWGYIPANSIILRAWYEVIVPFAGGTSYDIGFEDVDGNAINVDGLWNDLLLASINVAQERGLSAGDALGTAPTLDMYFIVTATGTFTAGQLRLVVEYAPPSTTFSI